MATGGFTLMRRVSFMPLAATVALMWTFVSVFLLNDLHTSIRLVGWLVVAVVVSETCFVAGLALLISAAAPRLVSGRGGSARSLLRHLRGARGQLRSLLEEPTLRRDLYLLGLGMNWFGAAMTTGILPLYVIFAELPWQQWGLGVIPAIDIAATCALRAPFAVGSTS